MKLLVTLWCGLVLAGTAHAADFKLDAAGAEPLYQTTLSKEVYQYSRSDRLQDLAVVNADGESIPYALLAYDSIHAQAKITAETKALTIFPMQVEGLQPSAEMHIQLNNHDASVNVRSSDASATAKNYYLFDLGEKHPAFKKLTLDWQGAEGKLVTLEVKASDNLQDWTSVAQTSVLKVTTNDQAILQNSVNFDRLIGARYLQILPQDAHDDFNLTAVNVEFSHRLDIVQPILWQEISFSQRALSATQTHIDFEASSRYPARYLKVNLPQQNTITQVTIFTRNGKDDAWHSVSKASLYRLTKQNKAYVNQDIAIPTTTARYWRLSFNQASGGIGKANPVLSLGWLPDILVWNARGKGPYSLQVGDTSKAANVVLVTSLVQAYQPEKVQQLPQSKLSLLTPEQTGNAWETPADYKPLWLWGGLLLGVLALAVMAYSLIKNNPKI
jgi:hypothetical protein